MLFLALTAASVYGFCRRLWPIVRKILQSKKDPGFHLFPIGRRVRDFVWEVMFQAKVIRERPLAGFAHALVFWAFCAFALVTLNHCASIFGLGFLDPAGRVGRFYFDFAAVFAVACAVSIFGLFLRRFVARPKWLGAVSWESGLIALLIFVLMVTYLAAFFVPGASTAARALWWAHTITLLAFLPVIPHTKHLHLLLSPFTIFLSRGGFAEIPPLADDEDFGLVAGKDLTQLVSLQAYSCVECGRCMEHCPANNTGKLLNPKEIVLGLRDYLNEYGPASEEPLLGKYNALEAAFECTTCGACEFQCPVGIEHVPIIVGLRRGAVNTGAWEDDHGAKLFLALERVNAYNAYQSIIRGGHTFLTIRTGPDPITNIGDRLDLIIPLNQDTMDRHLSLLTSGGACLYNADQIRPGTPQLEYSSVASLSPRSPTLLRIRWRKTHSPWALRLA